MLGDHADFNNLSFNKIELTCGREYSFQVSAINDLGQGPFSEPTSIIAGLKPDPPVELSKVSASINHITFDWIAGQDNCSPITSYRIMWNFGVGDSVSTLLESINVATEYTVGDPSGENTAVSTILQSCQDYKFKLVAVNAIGESDQS